MSLSISNSRALILRFFLSGAIVFALLIAASEFLLRKEVLSQDTLGRHVALFNETRSPYAAFGDSHVARGFNATAPVVNLAYPSENIERMRWKATRYLERTPAPEIVLLQADPHLFSPYRISAGLSDYPRAFGEAPPIFAHTFSTRYRPQLMDLWQSFVLGGGSIRSKIEQTRQGALLSPGNLTQWGDGARTTYSEKRVELHRPVDAPGQSNAARQFTSMVQDFTDRGARVCLVAMPVSPDYRQAFSQLGDKDRDQWEAAFEFFDRLAENPNVLLLDYRAAVHDPSHFRDPDHLNRVGAIAFSKRLQEECFETFGAPRIAEAQPQADQ